MNHRSSVALGLVVLSAIGYSQGNAYAIDASRELFDVDLTTGMQTPIGIVGNPGTLIESLGVAPDGRLFGSDLDGNFYEINTTTAGFTLLFNTGLSVEGMDWYPATSRMLVSTRGPLTQIYAIDINTFTTSLVATSTSFTGTNRALSTRDGSTVVDFRKDVVGDGSNHFSFDLATGILTGHGGVTSTIKAMDRGTDGVLYGLNTSGVLYSIDPATGNISQRSSPTGKVYLGMATNPVPEPASMLALAAGSALLLRRRRKAA